MSVWPIVVPVVIVLVICILSATTFLWGLNTLFGLGIDYSAKNILAAMCVIAPIAARSDGR